MLYLSHAYVLHPILHHLTRRKHRDHMREFIDKYSGQFILLQDGEVKWHNDDSIPRRSRRQLVGDKPDQAMWLKYVDPTEAEGEHFEVYERTLRRMSELGY